MRILQNQTPTEPVSVAVWQHFVAKGYYGDRLKTFLSRSFGSRNLEPGLIDPAGAPIGEGQWPDCAGGLITFNPTHYALDWPAAHARF